MVRFDRSSLTRALALSLAACTLATQLAANVHLAAVRHAVCEHGDLVEVGEARPHGTDRATAIASDSTASAREHEHCPFTPAHQRAVSNRVATFVGVAPITAARAPQLAPATRGAAIAIWLIAPKSSPPA
jgi:hypothetical protein